MVEPDVEWKTCILNSKDLDRGDTANKILSPLYLLNFLIDAAIFFPQVK